MILKQSHTDGKQKNKKMEFKLNKNIYATFMFFSIVIFNKIFLTSTALCMDVEHRLEHDLMYDVSVESVERQLDAFLNHASAQEKVNFLNTLTEHAQGIVDNVSDDNNISWSWTKRILVSIGAVLLIYIIYKYSVEILNNLQDTHLNTTIREQALRVARRSIQGNQLVRNILSSFHNQNPAA